jgi:hypothetical protein
MNPSYTFIEYILQYTSFPAILASLFSYRNEFYKNKTYHWIDITGVTVCALNSHFYHRYLYKLLDSTHDSVNVFKLRDGVIMYYIDLVSILTRSFFGTLTKIKYIGDNITPNITFIFYLTTALHLFSICFCYFILSHISNKKMYISCRNNVGLSQKYISLVHFSLFVPTGLTLWVITFGCNNLWLILSHSTHTIITGLITFFKPCGNYNHIILHLLIILQCYIIGSCNMCLE